MRKTISAILLILAVPIILASCSAKPVIPHRLGESGELVENTNSKPDALEDYTAKDLFELGYLYPDTLVFQSELSDNYRHVFVGEGDSVRSLNVSHGTLSPSEDLDAPLLAAGFSENELTGSKKITGTLWYTAKSAADGIETRGYVTALGDEYYLVEYSFPVDGETAKAQASGIEYGLYMRLLVQ